MSTVERSGEGGVQASTVMDHDGDFTILWIVATVEDQTSAVSDVKNYETSEVLALERGQGAELVHLYRHFHVGPKGGSTGGAAVVGEGEFHVGHIDHADNPIGSDTQFADSFEEGNIPDANSDLGQVIRPQAVDYTSVVVDEGAGQGVNERDVNFRENYGFGPVVDWEDDIGIRLLMNGNDNSEVQYVIRAAFLPMTIERIDEDFRFRDAIR